MQTRASVSDTPVPREQEASYLVLTMEAVHNSNWPNRGHRQVTKGIYMYSTMKMVLCVFYDKELYITLHLEK